MKRYGVTLMVVSASNAANANNNGNANNNTASNAYYVAAINLCATTGRPTHKSRQLESENKESQTFRLCGEYVGRRFLIRQMRL